jgi:hypothetical protein
MKKMICILLVFGFSLAMFASAVIPDATERGQEPQCQGQCLANHIRVMRRLSDELARTGKVFVYQDLVEQEVSAYCTCSTNCRKIIPVK